MTRNEKLQILEREICELMESLTEEEVLQIVKQLQAMKAE